MQTTIDKRLRHAFLVDEDGLNNVLDFVAGRYDDTEITVKCAGETKLEMGSVEELLGYRNPSQQRIESIEIGGGRAYSGEGVRIDLGSRWFSRGLSFNVASSNVERATYEAAEIEKLMAG